MTVSLFVPHAWSELTQPQLRQLFCAMEFVDILAAVNEYSGDDIKVHSATKAFIAWNDLTPGKLTPNGHTFVTADGKEFSISVKEMAFIVSHYLSWIFLPPDAPVALQRVGKAVAVAPPDISDGLSFGQWLEAENLWQGFIATSNPELLNRLGELLYSGMPDIVQVRNISAFYWWSSLKPYLAECFKHFFSMPEVPKPEGTSSIPDFNSMRRQMDAQIRALTKGDITKESQILSLPAWRALTELDALAYEYSLIKKK